MSTYLIFASILSLAMFVQSAVGFGGALVAVPLLSLILNPRETIPTLALVEIVVNALLVVQSRKSTSWRTVGWFLVGAVPACYLGVYTLAHLPLTILRILISVLTLLFASLFIFKVSLKIAPKSWAKVSVGLVSGFLGGSISISGPPVVLFALAQNWEKEIFRATLLSYFFLLAICTGSFSLIQGLLTEKGIALFASGIVPALVASFFGVLVKGKLSEELFRRAVLAIIVIVSFVGLATLRGS